MGSAEDFGNSFQWACRTSVLGCLDPVAGFMTRRMLAADTPRPDLSPLDEVDGHQVERLRIWQQSLPLH